MVTALVQQCFSFIGTSMTLVDCHLEFITLPISFFYTLLVVRIATIMRLGTMHHWHSPRETYGGTTVSALSTILLPSEL